MKDQIEEAERLNMDAVKRGRLVERHPEDPQGRYFSFDICPILIYTSGGKCFTSLPGPIQKVIFISPLPYAM